MLFSDNELINFFPELPHILFAIRDVLNERRRNLHEGRILLELKVELLDEIKHLANQII
jgi:hypothetical protein